VDEGVVGEAALVALFPHFATTCQWSMPWRMGAERQKVAERRGKRQKVAERRGQKGVRNQSADRSTPPVLARPTSDGCKIFKRA
jgi:hypothetical protein